MGVLGAGDDSVNGWYVRKEAAEGPPAGWDVEDYDGPWTNRNQGPYWYEKDDDCFMYQDYYYEEWHICSTNSRRYTVRCPVPVEGRLVEYPPSQGWDSTRRRPWDVATPGDAAHPPPTL